eukprot:TRINITY_DN6548_c0_g1_i1.p1 TRINITY_DN6548_c0_g1~~TRINITY_DN6548_c0_g1_i1.p1  ORF type:complete len:365 (+),score=101.27 TRINITY_DN6548_c0_g1_i1:2-1096(+)
MDRGLKRRREGESESDSKAGSGDSATSGDDGAAIEPGMSVSVATTTTTTSHPLPASPAHAPQWSSERKKRRIANDNGNEKEKEKEEEEEEEKTLPPEQGDSGTTTPDVVLDLRVDVEKRAREILHHTIPTKIVALDRLWQELKGRENIEASEKVVAEATTEQKLKELAAGNKHLRYLIGCVKTEITDLIEIGATLRLWVKLSMPSCDEVQSFEYQVKEEMIAELHLVSQSGTVLSRTLFAYVLNRAVLVEDTMENPVEEVIAVLPEVDNEQVLSLTRWIRDLSNMYQLVLDVTTKNLLQPEEQQKTDKQKERRENSNNSKSNHSNKGSLGNSKDDSTAGNSPRVIYRSPRARTLSRSGSRATLL